MSCYSEESDYIHVVFGYVYVQYVYKVCPSLGYSYLLNNQCMLKAKLNKIKRNNDQYLQ